MRPLRLAVLIAVLLLGAAFTSRVVGASAAEAMPVWLASGVTFSGLLVTQRWLWPAVLGGAGVASAIWGIVAYDLGPGPALVFGAIEVVSIGLAGWVATAGQRGIRTLTGASLMVLGAFVGAVVGALFAVQFWRWQSPGLEGLVVFRTWSFAAALGLLIVPPVVLAFRGFRVQRSGGLPMPHFLGGAIAYLVFVGTTLWVFGTHPDPSKIGAAAGLTYLPMPFLLIAAQLWGARGGALGGMVGALLIIACTARGGGAFAVGEDYPGEALIEVQGLAIMWAVVLIMTRALSESRRVALESSRVWKLRYARTLEAVGMISVEYDARTGRATWGESAPHFLGSVVEHAQSLNQWLDNVEVGERGPLLDVWNSVARGDVPTSEHRYAVRLADGAIVRVLERLAGVRGADGTVEQVVGLLRMAPEVTLHG